MNCAAHMKTNLEKFVDALFLWCGYNLVQMYIPPTTSGFKYPDSAIHLKGLLIPKLDTRKNRYIIFYFFNHDNY